MQNLIVQMTVTIDTVKIYRSDGTIRSYRPRVSRILQAIMIAQGSGMSYDRSGSTFIFQF